MIQSATYEYSTLGGNTQKVSIKLVYQDGKTWSVPIDNENRHYQEILEWVANGGTIVDNGA